jgi:glycosyltransferase involved in cell wall biosynthesis
MKIVNTIDDFDPNKGYLEYYLARELTKLGSKVYVFTCGCSKKTTRIMLEEGFEVIIIPQIAFFKGFSVPSITGVINIVRFIKTEKPDVIQCHPLYSPLSLIFMLFQRCYGYRIVGGLGSQLFSINSFSKKVLYHFGKIIIEQYMKNKIDLIFVKSEAFMKLLIELFNVDKTKFRIIPLGADPELFKFDIEERNLVRNQLGLSTGDVVVVYSGKIVPSKRLDILIKALAPIISQNDYVKLLFVGEGESSYIAYLNGLLLNLNMSKNVIFHPWVHRTKLPAFFAASDIAVWPGLSSISIVEACSVGLPVIIADSPTEIYSIEDGNGFVFEPGNVAELRKYLKRLICDDKLRKDMGMKSRLLVEKKLNWETIAYQFLDMYKSIVHS